jgi:hypothetical protein
MDFLKQGKFIASAAKRALEWGIKGRTFRFPLAPFPAAREWCIRFTAAA